VGGHEFEGVEEHEDGYVLVCQCGWRSHVDESARAIGTAWDAHRASVGATR
jgi:hypothetical protein